jgi:hypothetical protein
MPSSAGSVVEMVEAYVERLHEIHERCRGTPDLSFRAAPENLLNAVGERLDPAVQATAELADTGAGPTSGSSTALLLLGPDLDANYRAAAAAKPVAF